MSLVNDSQRILLLIDGVWSSLILSSAFETAKARRETCLRTEGTSSSKSAGLRQCPKCDVSPSYLGPGVSSAVFRVTTVERPGIGLPGSIV